MLDDIVSNLNESIESGDHESTLVHLEELENLALTDVDCINWVTNPPNITHLHQIIMDNLGVPHRLLLLKNRVPNKHRRAIMFIKIMYNAVSRIKEVKDNE